VALYIYISEDRTLQNTKKSESYTSDQVKKDEVGSACSTNGEKRNAYRILVGKTKT
jgi:hypothetical protein